MNGKPVDPVTPETKHLRPTSELPMHLECYQQRSDIGGVIHAHPPIATALTIVDYDFQRCIIPKMIVTLGLVPTAPYSTPSGTENRDAIRELIFDHDTILLAHQGSLTVAHTVLDAYLHLEILEHCASILQYAEQLGGHKKSIPWHQVEKLLDLREQKGLLRPGDTMKFRRICGKATGYD
jgi:L-fuculose-phosphate aldolase